MEGEEESFPFLFLGLLFVKHAKMILKMFDDKVRDGGII